MRSRGGGGGKSEGEGEEEEFGLRERSHNSGGDERTVCVAEAAPPSGQAIRPRTTMLRALGVVSRERECA